MSVDLLQENVVQIAFCHPELVSGSSIVQNLNIRFRTKFGMTVLQRYAEADVEDELVKNTVTLRQAQCDT